MEPSVVMETVGVLRDHGQQGVRTGSGVGHRCLLHERPQVKVRASAERDRGIM